MSDPTSIPPNWELKNEKPSSIETEEDLINLITEDLMNKTFEHSSDEVKVRVSYGGLSQQWFVTSIRKENNPKKFDGERFNDLQEAVKEAIDRMWVYEKEEILPD